MHIILANRFYPPQGGYGGIAMHNHYYSRALVQLGHKVTIISSRASSMVPEFEMIEGIEVYRIHRPYHYRLSRLPLFGRYVWGLDQWQYSQQVSWKIVETEKYTPIDFVEFADVNAEGFTYLHRKERKPVIIRCQTPNFVLARYAMPGSMPFDLRLNIWMERTAIRTADSLIAPSNDIAKVIENGCNLPSKCVHVIPDALDIDLWDDSDREHTNQDDVITILHVGRLEQVKGIEVLVKAIPSVLRQIPKARFVFIGAARSDQQASYWQEKLKNVGGEHILIMGFLEQTELAYWYHQSDIAVVPSLNYESFSYTCAQAMAAGLPVVASRIGGIPETVDDRKSGILFEPGDIESLGKAIIALAKDKDLRIHMGRVAREKAKRTFSALDCAKNSVELFSTILKS